MAESRRSRAPLVTGVVFLLIGLAVAGAGVWLLALGGSWYYLPAGIGFAAVGALLWRRSIAALWMHALLVAGTLAWSLWEAGLDWWPLAARNDVPFVLGLWLLTPWVVRALRGRVDAAAAVRAGPPRAQLALGAALAAVLLVSALSWSRDEHRIEGRAPAPYAAAPEPAGVPPGEWHAYGRTGHGQRYSPLDQIDATNVARLQVAWTYRTGDVRGRPDDPVETTFEVTPLKVGQRLFLCTPHQSVVALDATTGRQIWRVDLQVRRGLALQHLTCRGLGYRAPDPAAAAQAPGDCAARLFMPTADGRLVALDPQDGSRCTRFGGGDGEVDLWAGMPKVRPGAYYSTSPPVVTRSRVIVGGTVLDNASTVEPSGVIRAYDADTGALVWNWDSGNPDDTAPLPPGRTYTPSSPNSWSVSSVDEALGLVYVPMGNQPPDQWGAERNPAGARYSSAVVALDLATGRVRWHFQTVHHDLWDYDVPAQPTLVDLRLGGRTVPALVQPTKQGEIFVLDRRDGRPLLPVREVPAPASDIPGERAAPTQPVSALSFDPPPLQGRDMWGATMFHELACRIALRRLRYEGRFTPPSLRGTLVYPGNFGVFNWGGVAVDPRRQIVFATPAYLAFFSRLVPRKDDTTLYVQGKHAPQHGTLPALNENFGAPYAVRLGPFVSPLGIPCQEPPWGYVAAADLTTGKILWMHRNGTVRDLAPIPLPFRMGVPSLGGPIVTAGGLAFLSGTLDYYVRAYDLTTGRELWRGRLPAGGQATPMTYLGADGRQYLLVVAGGHGSLGTQAGDYVIAYALPER
ncbi:membrane-bound PQQ-dependent dehydrogenase, glucose/quinate/shikimate family [Vulcaniibacterium tengchongense]|uniref:Quinoprotein glucose dehydrogenase n=1 Tax=Vulcaniibacterium tengchongense TaxID=1273429 RepID=A0A3N4VFX2_9GAMM|nr:membrane-bound PQQ-dependent dehydrogenase, glucose/quinate/shikimate family [Vulcaniibacterium tengchongense]RPE81922.1 quinoprotein glucose dehydrogenase [Vulcaniibacterium tengchongense]